MNSHDYCPHCGAPQLPEPVSDGLDLTGTERALVNALRERPGKWVTTDWLFNQMYGLDPNGGPLLGGKMVHIYVHKIRKKLGSGFILSRISRRDGGYMWVGGETKGKKNNGKARTKEEAGSPSTERATATGA